MQLIITLDHILPIGIKRIHTIYKKYTSSNQYRKHYFKYKFHKWHSTLTTCFPIPTHLIYTSLGFNRFWFFECEVDKSSKHRVQILSDCPNVLWSIATRSTTFNTKIMSTFFCCPTNFQNFKLTRDTYLMVIYFEWFIKPRESTNNNWGIISFVPTFIRPRDNICRKKGAK